MYNDETSATDSKQNMREFIAFPTVKAHAEARPRVVLRTLGLSFKCEWEKTVYELAASVGVTVGGYCVEGVNHDVFKEMKACLPAGYKAVWGNIAKPKLFTRRNNISPDLDCVFLDYCGAPDHELIDSLVDWINFPSPDRNPTVWINIRLQDRKNGKSGIIRKLSDRNIVKAKVKMVEDAVLYAIKQACEKKLLPQYGVKLTHCMQYVGGRVSDMLLLGFTRTNDPTDTFPTWFPWVKYGGETNYEECRPVGKRHSINFLCKHGESATMIEAGHKASVTRIKRTGIKPFMTPIGHQYVPVIPKKIKVQEKAQETRLMNRIKKAKAELALLITAWIHRYPNKQIEIMTA